MAQAPKKTRISTKRGTPFTNQTAVFDLPDVPTNEITNLSNSKPAIATSLAHGLSTSDAIWLESETNSAINGYYLVSVNTEDSFAVIGLNGEDLGTITDAKFTKLIRYPFCDATSIKISPIKTKETDVTTNCDEDPVTEVQKESGTISMSGLWMPDKKVQDFLEEMAEETETIFLTVKPKKSKTLRGYQVKITSFDEDGKSGDLWQFSMELKLIGRQRKLDTTSGVI